MSSENQPYPEPVYDWRLRTIEANVASLRRDLTRLETRIVVVEVKLAMYAALGGLVGGAAGAMIVALVASQS